MAQRALAEATTLPEMKDVRSWAEALRAYARSRGMGIDAENQAAEVVIRAERKMGGELARMAEAGERATQAGNNLQALPRLQDLGIERHHAEDWVRLATIPDEDWDSLVVELLANGERLSRMDFVRAYFGDRKYPREPLRDDAIGAWDAWAEIVKGSAGLGKALKHGWPLQSDRTLRGWGEVNDEITAAGRALLLFQKRVAAHMAALGTTPGEETVTT
jgi:hypothetical protein